MSDPDRWVASHHAHGITIHDRGCFHVDETMEPHPALRLATREQAISYCRVMVRTKMCKWCARRVIR